MISEPDLQGYVLMLANHLGTFITFFSRKSLKYIITYFCIILMVFPFSLYAELAVSPLMIDLHLKPGEKKDFSINVKSIKGGKIRTFLFDMGQEATGHMTFTKKKLGTKGSITNWVELENTKYRINKGKSINVKGTVKAPHKENGTKLVAVMIEEVFDNQDQKGVKINVRYAVILVLHLKKKGKRRHKVENTEISVFNKDNKLFLEANIKNISKHDLMLQSYLQIRDKERMLVERSELKSLSSWQRNDNGSKIFPGSTVKLFNELKHIKSPGEYTILIKNKVNKKGIGVIRKTITIDESLLPKETDKPEKQSFISQKSSSPITITPELLLAEVRKNGSSFNKFKIKNNTSKVVTAFFPTIDKFKPNNTIISYEFIPKQVKIPSNHYAQVLLKQKYNMKYTFKDLTYPLKLVQEGKQLQSSLIQVENKQE